MTLLMLPRYEALGASSRLRMLQYLPWLEAAGFQVQVESLLDDDYVRGLYDGRVSARGVARGYARRARRLHAARGSDCIWLEKEGWPWLPGWIERAAMPRRPGLVIDYDDAVFHRYDRHRAWLVRQGLGRKIDGLMRGADLVTAGNDYLAERAQAAGAARVEIVPTVVDLDRYVVPDRAGRTGPVVVGWIGSPATAHYLQAVAEPLRRLQATREIACVAVGARPDQVAGTPFVAEPWTEAGEAAQLARFDIGLMPLEDGEWERGKCGYKLVQYMASGLPVVASPIGVNRRLVGADNGLLASDAVEWTQALARLVDDAPLRRAMGAAGRRRVERGYSVQVQGPRVAGLLRDAGSRR